MPTKVCSKCGIEKDLSLFNKNKNMNDGHQSRCRDCANEASSEYRSTHKEERRLKDKENYEHLREVSKVYMQSRKEESRVYQKEYYRKNRDKKIAFYSQEWQIEKRKEWRKNNREYLNAYFKDYYEKYPEAKMARTLRTRIYKVLKGKIKYYPLEEVLGCSYEFLIQHIESQFTEGMTWENHGFGKDKWNIDHTPPLSYYTLSDPEQQKEAFHWSHISPIWTFENISKNSWYNGERYFYRKD